jgi:hypothetical protein
MSQPKQNIDLTEDQKLVLNDCHEAHIMIEKLKSTEPDDGDITWIAASIGRGLRLVEHLNNQSELATTWLLATTIDLLKQAHQEFLQHVDWHDTLILETNFQDAMDEFEGLLANPDTSSLELMSMMIDLDRLVCALGIVHDVDEICQQQQYTLIRGIQILTEVYLDSSMKLASSAKNFIVNQGVKGDWGKVWENFIHAELKVNALEKVFREADEMDLKQPMQPYGFFED